MPISIILFILFCFGLGWLILGFIKIVFVLFNQDKLEKYCQSAKEDLKLIIGYKVQYLSKKI